MNAYIAKFNTDKAIALLRYPPPLFNGLRFNRKSITIDIRKLSIVNRIPA
jgi:hypothetical protein